MIIPYFKVLLQLLQAQIYTYQLIQFTTISYNRKYTYVKEMYYIDLLYNVIPSIKYVSTYESKIRI